VHIFLSLHGFESSGVKTHPVAGLQLSSVQGLSSLQILGVVPTHTPRLHASAVVPGVASSHEAVLLAWMHPVDGLQESFVQTLPSLQLIAVPAHIPPKHVSAKVQALWSSHDAVLFVCTQLPAGLHVSSVHALPSSQTDGGRPRQVPGGTGAKRKAIGTDPASTVADSMALVEQAGEEKRIPPRTLIPFASKAVAGLIRYDETCATRR
jgi:hypothetical protein